MEYTDFFKANKPEEAADFFRKKLIFTLGPMDIGYMHSGRIKTDAVIVDVRAEKDYREAHIPGAINLPESRWETTEGLSLLSKDKLNIIYCYTQTCHLAARAAFFFAGKGYPVSEMEGGFEAYKDYKLKVETGDRKVA
jgi:rhodanese-related sulfurtransferase